MKRLIAVISILIISSMFNSSVEAKQMNLYQKYSDRGEVKVYVEDIKAFPGMQEEALEGLKEELDNALFSRMTINFKLTKVKEEAEIIIECEIKDFVFDFTEGIKDEGLNPFSKKNYARIQVFFQVFDVAKNKRIWKGREKASVKDNNASRNELIQMLNEKIIKNFLKECFSSDWASVMHPTQGAL